MRNAILFFPYYSGRGFSSEILRSRSIRTNLGLVRSPLTNLVLKSGLIIVSITNIIYSSLLSAKTLYYSAAFNHKSTSGIIFSLSG